MVLRIIDISPAGVTQPYRSSGGGEGGEDGDDTHMPPPDKRSHVFWPFHFHLARFIPTVPEGFVWLFTFQKSSIFVG